MNSTEEDDLAAEIEDGTYYDSARGWYSDIFHTPIAERSYYIVIIILSLLSFYYATVALIRIYPIKSSTPFIVYSENVWEDLPYIKRLAESPHEDRNTAVMRYMIGDYITARESYDLPSYESRYRNTWNHSTSAVFEIYKHQIDASNPRSPYRQYTDLGKRTVTIQSIDFERGAETSHAHVVFTASVVSVVTKKEVQHTKWSVDLTYKYTDFKVMQKTGTKNPLTTFFGLTEDSSEGSGEKREVVPMTFVVSDYQLKELLE